MIKRIVSNFLLLQLKILAKIQILKIKPTIIGVGGAAGKTSLSNFISIILREKHKVRDTKGKNSETGIPLSILGLSVENYSILEWFKIIVLAYVKVIFDWNHYNFLIAEMGIDSPIEPKNMSYLLKIIRPKIGVLTNIALEHSEYFDPLVKSENQSDRKKKILEITSGQEELLLRSLPKDGSAVLNIDDPQIAKIKDIKATKIIVSAKNKNADFFIKKIEVAINKFNVQFSYNGDNYEIKLLVPLPSYYAYSLILSIGVSVRCGVSVSKSIQILERNFSLPHGRATIFEGIKNTKIIDSSYNNLPSAVVEMLEFLNQISNKRRRVAVIGDMRELGSLSLKEHKTLGEKLIKNTDLTILIGPLTAMYTAPVLRKSKHFFYSFLTFTEAKKNILENIKQKDVILIKGSQNTLYLERVAQMLLKDKKDIVKLCRRGIFWDKRRSNTL
ncbi:MAG: Mur ligase family protein [Patescibacteria group bacterium]